LTRPQADELTSCCVATYSHPLARWLLGDSLHPGGVVLSARLAGLAEIGQDSLVLDLGSGRGASAVHLAKTIGCRVVGVTLEEDGYNAARETADRNGVGNRATFLKGDIRQVVLEPESFDAVLLECVLSILPDKAAVLDRARGFMKPGARLALTDVTVNGPLPEELHAVLAVVGCVGDARSLIEYCSLAEGAGLHLEHSQDLPDTAASLLRDIKGKLLMAEVAAKVGKLPLDEDLLRSGKRYLALAQELVSNGTLSYGLVVARKPGRHGFEHSP